MSLEPVPLRDGFEEQVMVAAARSARRHAPGGPRRRRDAVDAGAHVEPPARRCSPRPRVLVLGGFALGRVTGAPTAPSDEFQILRLQGDAPGSVSVAYRPGETGGLILGSDVPAAAGDDVYALWTITGETPALVGCFSPDDGSSSSRSTRRSTRPT